jgi:hypothetical protein
VAITCIRRRVEGAYEGPDVRRAGIVHNGLSGSWGSGEEAIERLGYSTDPQIFGPQQSCRGVWVSTERILVNSWGVRM